MQWLITNRNELANGFGAEHSKVTYWRADAGADPTRKASWTKFATKEDFHNLLIATADQFPHPVDTDPKDQRHVTLLVHGYNNNWQDAMGLYRRVSANLFAGDAGLGECVSFDWPSKGSLAGYLPDRSEARQSAQDLAEVFGDLYDWLLGKQRDAAKDIQKACKAKTSVIAHSMGNYVLECAMNYAWTQKNRPLLVSMIHEALMIAADVDNDLFHSGETTSSGDGEGIANLTYRITALYSGRDAVLGASAGLKHFGKRRLGRSGLDLTYPLPDNVWEVDCSNLIFDAVNGIAVHSSYFDPGESDCYPLMKRILQGIDRGMLIAEGSVPTGNTKHQVMSSPKPTTVP